MRLERHIEISGTEKKAVDVLAESTALSKQVIKQAMAKGAVWAGKKQGAKRIRRADKIAKPGESLHLYYDDEVLEKQPEPAVLISDEGIYSVWCKPYGMLSQGSKWGDHCTINRWAEQYLLPQRSAFVVHRLDRAATGLMIIAHKKKTAAYFSSLFHDRQIEKEYQAIVHGEFHEYVKLESVIDNKPALSHARCLEYDVAANQSLVKVSIETGRKHQIRRHLSEAGFPIVGDRLYGDGNDKGDRDLCLIACHLSFISPVDNLKKIYTLPGIKLTGL